MVPPRELPALPRVSVLEFGNGEPLAHGGTETTSRSTHYHAFDALRACALMLGIIYHAIWSFIPFYFGAPIVDRSGNIVFYYLFLVIHIFRMPVFFVMAGFFAHLVYMRRGGWGFLRHRFLRIGIPLVLFWFLLVPLVVHSYVWGIMGAGVKNLGVNSIEIALDVSCRMWTNVHHFRLMHLWFLYYLLIFYVFTMLVHQPVNMWLDRAGAAKQQMDRIFGWLMRSRWNLLILTLPAAAIYRQASWVGLDHGDLVPNRWALSIYFLCFAMGWLLHRQNGLLDAFQHRWALRLALALVLSVPLIALSQKYYPYDRFLWFKVDPALDMNALSQSLKVDLESKGDNPGKRLWEVLPKYEKERLLAGPVDAPEFESLMAEALNQTMNIKDFYRPADFAHIAIPEKAQMILRKDRSAWSYLETVTLNRCLLEAAFPKALPRVQPLPPEYGVVKCVHALLYALVMWLYIFGFVGLFLTCCNRESVAWRYLADSSYWIYLIHLPLIQNLQVAMASWDWHWNIKFPLLLAVSGGLMFLSYHYLVRSTALGVLLNGRRH